MAKFLRRMRAKQRVMQMYRQLQLALQPYNATVEQLNLSNQGAWSMQLDTGTEMELGLGSQEQVLMRLKKFLASHSQVLATYQRSGLDRVESVDLRHAQGYAIRVRGVSTLVAAPSDK
jgi:cell division protein FtsQ